MSYNKKELAAQLRTIYENLSQQPPSASDLPCKVVAHGFTFLAETTGEVPAVEDSSADPRLYLRNPGVLAERQFVRECLKDREIADAIGEKAIRELLNARLQGQILVMESNVDFDEAVRGFLKELRATLRTWRVCIPVSNLKLDQPVQLCGVFFHAAGTFTVHDLHAQLRDHAQGTIIYERLFATLQNDASAWAIAEVTCHESRWLPLARIRVEAALNAIRAFIRLFHQRQDLQYAVGLPYELTHRTSGAIASSGGVLQGQSDSAGGFIPFALTEERRLRLEADAMFSEISDVLSRPIEKLTPLENAVRVAVSWLGRSIIAAKAADSFLFCTICIERLLFKTGETSTTDKFAERLTCLVEDDRGSRRQAFTAAKSLYDVRSEIVHAGFESVTPSQLDDIEQFAINAVVDATRFLKSYRDRGRPAKSDHARLLEYLLDRRWE